MNLRGWLVAALALAPSCGGGPPIPDEEIGIHVTAEARDVELGKAFSLTVVCVWSKALVPGEWRDQALAPLVVRLEETTRREDDGHVEETRRYRCYAFISGDVAVPAMSFKASPRDGGPERIASADALTFRVKPALTGEAAGPAELPGEPLPKPFPWVRWSMLGAAGLVALSVLAAYVRRRREPSQSPLPSVPSISPRARALDRLTRLRERQPGGPAEIEGFYVEASDLVREFIEEELSVRAPEMTTEEFLAARETARALEPSHRELLSEFLAQCDLVKFARYAPAAADRESLLEAAERFLSEARAKEASDFAALSPPERDRAS